MGINDWWGAKAGNAGQNVHNAGNNAAANRGRGAAASVPESAWRFAGFGSDGSLIAFEFAAPAGASESLPFKPSRVIGRDPTQCDEVISEPTVSRRHAELRFFPGEGLALRDLGSFNGTYVEDVRIDENFVLLRTGSQVRFGSFAMLMSLRR